MGCSSVEEYKKMTIPVYVAPRGVSTAYRIQTKVGRAGNLPNVITHAKCYIYWNTIVTLAKGWSFSTSTADAINKAKPCRADCDTDIQPRDIIGRINVINNYFAVLPLLRKLLRCRDGTLCLSNHNFVMSDIIIMINYVCIF